MTFWQNVQNIEFIPMFFLCLQASIVYTSLEVFYRYTRWYVSIVDKTLMLGGLVLGIVITHAAIFAERVSWMYENVKHPQAVDLIQSHLSGEYGRLLFIRVALLTGIVIHLIPVWRIVDKSSPWTIAGRIAARCFMVIALYFGLLYLSGGLVCLLEVGCHMAGS